MMPIIIAWNATGVTVSSEGRISQEVQRALTELFNVVGAKLVDATDGNLTFSPIIVSTEIQDYIEDALVELDLELDGGEGGEEVGEMVFV